jgi:hypothetical protein
VDAAGAHPGTRPTEDAECAANAGSFDERPNDGWYTADLLEVSFGAINLEGATQFRLRISGSGMKPSSGRAIMRFFAPEASAADSPLLLVRYRLP